MNEKPGAADFTDYADGALQMLLIARHPRNPWLLASSSFSYLLRLHLKRSALHDAENKRRKAIIVSSRIANDRPNHGHVVIVYGPAERIRQKLLGCVADKRIRPAYKRLPQTSRAVQFSAIHQFARRIDRLVAIDVSPLPGQVEVFQREADGVHDLVTRRAAGIRAMFFHALAHGKHFAVRPFTVLLQRRHTCWNRRGRHTEDVFQNPLAAADRRRAIDCRG